MEVEIWDGGLQEQEVSAIEKIKVAFSVKPTKKKQSRGTSSLQAQLKSTGLASDAMFPWKGYAGFRFVGSKKEGEFDLVIVTHCNVLIVELKDWNHAPITAIGDKWYKGGKDMGRSPVSVTRPKMFTLKNKLNKFKHRFSNKGYIPFIEFFIVVTGNTDISGLRGEQRKHTLTLADFLKFANQEYFEKEFNPHPNSKVLNKDFCLFDELFGNSKTAPKPLRVAGYEAQEKIFDHPKKVYKEYLAKSEIPSSSEVLLRVWDFRKIEGTKAYTPEGRSDIVSREQEILQYIRHQNLDLYNHCLRSLTSFQKDEVTAKYSEVYELPPGHVRFNEFVGKYGKAFSEQDRLNVTKLVLAKFSDLHQIKIAHRDIADHSLWISPSKAVALSNFISAYHQPIGTVGDYRQSLSVGAIEAAEMLNDEKRTPYQQDVHALGLVAWHLLSGERMSPKSMESIQEDMLSCDKWYAEVLLDAVTASYESATAFFDALKNAEPVGKEISTFDDSELDAYRHSIHYFREYPDDDGFIVESDAKEVYFSNDYLVKVWLNTGGVGNPASSNFRVLRFLKLLDKLSSISPSFLPKIQAYGVATKSSALYLVTDKVEGNCWSQLDIPDNDARDELIYKFIASVEQLHGFGISHGDLHPENVMVSNDGQSLYLIDLPDFSSTDEPKNHLYSPDYIDSCTAFERDNFAVMKMSCELLGIGWAKLDDGFPNVSKVVLEELEDKEFGFKGLGRFKLSLQRKNLATVRETLNVRAGDAVKVISILPDNGKLFVKVVRNPKAASEVKVTLSGIGGEFSAFYKYAEQRFIVGFSPRERSSVSKRDEERSHFEIDKAIQVSPGRPQDLSALSEFFKEHELFKSALDNALAPTNTDSEPALKGSLTQEVMDAFAKLEQQTRTIATQEIEISTNSLWKALLGTETESNPNIEVIVSPIAVSNSKNELILSYSSDIDPLEKFGRNDEVDALLIDAEDNENVLGQVCLKSSALNEVKLVRTRAFANRLNDGEIVYFRSKQDRASYRKRKAALERILNGSSVIPHLAGLFDPSCRDEPIEYGISVTDEDFARYDREGPHGKLISLNPQQRQAFSKLLNHGPLSLLQGPPGTGKTEFIAAFVHYLIEKQNTKRILLVSQSHEAVNTAAERIRRHCANLGTSLEVVRFSNREGAVSIGLKDVYSQAITTEKRELFNAELKYRVQTLSDALGVDANFISDVVLAELQLFQQIDHLSSLLRQLDTMSNEEDISLLKVLCVDLNQTIRETLSHEYGFEIDSGVRVADIKEEVITKLCKDYRVRPDEVRRVRAMAKVTRDMQNALSGERVNYDEFYARSRQLVIGTCVGIGQGHIGINQNVYDWVIIDEAARSISSELAIAMQSGKRILLVGDHLQLPPLYSDAHKVALAKKLGISGSKAELDEVLQSDFARAFNSEYGQKASDALLTQYRMAAAIGTLVSETFYKGKLKNPSKEDQRAIPDFYLKGPKPIRNTVTWLDTSTLGITADHDDDRGTSIYNRCEADQIIFLLQEICDQDELREELTSIVSEYEAAIGVICMYAEQKRILRQKFNQEIWPDGFRELIKIDTVDSYQGKENRIIILSLTRSDKQQSPGFLWMPNRINVAMSRAMDRLLIVGNISMWKGKNRKLPLGKVLDYMSKHGECSGYAFMSAGKGGKRTR